MARKAKQFSLYPQMWDEFLTLHQRLSGKGSKASETDIVREFSSINPSFARSLDCAILAEEHYWREKSRQVIVPESKEVLDLLYKAKYDIETVSALSLPASSFILAMPPGIEIAGLPLTGCLVTWMPMLAYSEEVFYPLDRKLGYDLQRCPPRDTHNHDQNLLSLCFIDPSTAHKNGKQTTFARNRFFIAAEKIPALLRAESPEEFYRISGKYENSNMRWVSDSETHDILMQQYFMKIVMALAVYYSATEHSCVVEGLPSGKVDLKHLPNVRIKSSSLIRKHGRKASKAQQRKEGRTPHVRSWHFRQLRDERYYKGKYAGDPVGSRVVFVSESFVTG